MRNTHFGDSSFGFGGNNKLKNDLSLDSERKVSRKRGNKIGGGKVGTDDGSVRESV